MRSPDLLFLLLMSSCLPVLSAPPGDSTDSSLDEEQPNQQSKKGQAKEVSKKLENWFKQNYKGIGQVLVNSIEPWPVVGPPLAAAIKTFLLLIPEADTLNAIKSELRGLHFKLETFRAELKWDAWAAGAYQIPISNIEKAWIKYTELVSSYKTTDTEKEALKQKFVTFYSQYADSTLVLHRFLTAKHAAITQNLGDLLADRLRCHEKDIKVQFLYLNELMCKGNMLNEEYYEFTGTNTNARVNALHKIASQSASALTTSHQRCLSDSAAYIERDIFERIDDTKKHGEIEGRIRAFLAKTYDRYDWMVVALMTHNSKHDLSILNRHVLSGFTKVEKGTVTVAVAKQVKGGYTKTAAVKEAIKKCLPQRFKKCLNAAEKLQKCQETIFGKRLSQTYTAVHAFKKERKTLKLVEESDDEDSVTPVSSSLTNHLFTWDCGKFSGKFTIFIKSDEELGSREELCSEVDCGQNGKCVVVQGTFIAICECQYPYYGERCEMRLESCKRSLQQGLERRTQSPKRFQRSKSAPPTNQRTLQSNLRRSAQGESFQPTRGGSVNLRSQQSTSQSPSNRSSRQSASRHSSSRRSRQSASRRSSSHRSRQSTPRRSSNRRSQQSSSRRSSSRSSRQSASRRSSSRRSRQSTPRRSSNQRSRQSTPRRSSSRRSRQSIPQRSSNRRSWQSTSRRSSNRSSRQSASRHSSRRSSRQSASRRSSSHRSRQSTPRHSSNQRSRQSTP
ncbi:uncharacterized protein LOC144458859 [Epinephelus lanceolatus]